MKVYFIDRAQALQEFYKGTKAEELGIINEKCSCGHLRSDHEDTFSIGHGRCTKCSCKQFTWIGWVTKDENKSRFCQ